MELTGHAPSRSVRLGKTYQEAILILMALFQRQQDKDMLVKIVQDKPLATSDEGGFVKLIVGLGNIGKEYVSTRHNAGFMAVDEIQKQAKMPSWQEKTKFKAFISEEFIAGQKVILAKPTTLMNLSGESIKALKDFYKLLNSDITVIHDELDLNFGVIKEKTGGGSAGHNGLKSIISLIGEDFNRVRVGIKNEQLESRDAADFVLDRFSQTEVKQLGPLLDTLAKKILR